LTCKPEQLQDSILAYKRKKLRIDFRGLAW